MDDISSPEGLGIPHTANPVAEAAPGTIRQPEQNRQSPEPLHPLSSIDRTKIHQRFTDLKEKLTSPEVTEGGINDAKEERLRLLAYLEADEALKQAFKPNASTAAITNAIDLLTMTASKAPAIKSPGIMQAAVLLAEKAGGELVGKVDELKTMVGNLQDSAERLSLKETPEPWEQEQLLSEPEQNNQLKEKLVRLKEAKKLQAQQLKPTSRDEEIKNYQVERRINTDIELLEALINNRPLYLGPLLKAADSYVAIDAAETVERLLMASEVDRDPDRARKIRERAIEILKDPETAKPFESVRETFIPD